MAQIDVTWWGTHQSHHATNTWIEAIHMGAHTPKYHLQATHTTLNGYVHGAHLTTHWGYKQELGIQTLVFVVSMTISNVNIAKKI